MTVPVRPLAAGIWLVIPHLHQVDGAHGGLVLGVIEVFLLGTIFFLGVTLGTNWTACWVKHKEEEEVRPLSGGDNVTPMVIRMVIR